MVKESKLTRYASLPFITLLKVLRMNNKIKIGVIAFLCLGIIGVCEPIINKIRLGDQRPNTMGLLPPNSPPSWQAPFGSDVYGRDLFGMIIRGIRFTLTIGLTAATVELLIAIILGSLAGYSKGLIDHILRSVTDFIIVVPMWPLLVLISVYVPQIDEIGLSLVIAAFGWSWITRVIRSQVLSLSENPYIDLAKMSGFKTWEILFKEILPNILPYVGSVFAGSALAAMIAETGIRFLGVGPPTIVTLGYVLNFMLIGVGSGYLTARPYLLVPPILFLALIFVSLNLVNIGLDEAYNPRLKKITGM